jgi:hypothetical protein
MLKSRDIFDKTDLREFKLEIFNSRIAGNFFVAAGLSAVVIGSSSAVYYNKEPDTLPSLSSQDVQAMFSEATARQAAVSQADSIQAALDRGNPEIKIKIDDNVVTIPREKVEQAAQEFQENVRGMRVKISGTMALGGIALMAMGLTLKRLPENEEEPENQEKTGPGNTPPSP